MLRPVKQLSCTEMCLPADVQSMAAGFWTLGLELNSNGAHVGVQVSIKLSKKRKADVSEFRGTHSCNIREYYEVKRSNLRLGATAGLPQQQCGPSSPCVSNPGIWCS